MPDIQTIAASVTALARPNMKPKDLMAAVREMHPDASKKEVVRAAFYAAITQADIDPERARYFQDAALRERMVDDTETVKSKKRRKRDKHKDGK